MNDEKDPLTWSMKGFAWMFATVALMLLLIGMACVQFIVNTPVWSLVILIASGAALALQLAVFARMCYCFRRATRLRGTQ